MVRSGPAEFGVCGSRAVYGTVELPKWLSPEMNGPVKFVSCSPGEIWFFDRLSAPALKWHVAQACTPSLPACMSQNSALPSSHQRGRVADDPRRHEVLEGEVCCRARDCDAHRHAAGVRGWRSGDDGSSGNAHRYILQGQRLILLPADRRQRRHAAPEQQKRQLPAPHDATSSRMSDDKVRSASLTDRVSRRRGLCREAGSRYGHRQSSCVPKLRADRRPAWDRQRRISQPAHERESCRPALRRQDLGRHAGFRHTNGLPTSQRLAIRQQKVVPLIASLVCWMRAARGQMSRHVDIAKTVTRDQFRGEWNYTTSPNQQPP